MTPKMKSRSSEQPQTTSVFAPVCSEPQTDQMPGFLLVVPREDVLVFLPCANCSTDIKDLTS